MAKRKQKIPRDSINLNPPPSQLYPAVSVIIPLYNAEKYIGECLDSVLNQTFQNFELIVVDDCSTDSSCAIVESYAEKFGGRLTLSHMEKNTGSGAMPRNKGLLLARGKYIAFLDNDDFYTKTALEELYTLAKDFDADVVYCEDYHCVQADGSGLHRRIGEKRVTIDKPTFETNDMAERVRGILNSKYFVQQWQKFTLRNLLIEHELFFPNTCPADDDIWTYGLIIHAEKFLRVPNLTYCYRLSEDSIMRKEKTPQKTITFWTNPVLLGLKTLDKFISRHEFFRQNPQYRYAVLEKFINDKFGAFFSESFKIPPFDIYLAIKQEFGDKLGEWGVVISALCTALNTQQKINALNAQKFQKFAAQAQARIAQLEAEVKRLQT